MRVSRFALCAVLLSLPLSGCMTNKQPLALDRVGPASTEPGAGQDGSLLVFSARDTSAHFNTVAYRPIYSDYTILTEDGKLLQNVINRDTQRNSPNPVNLPAGKYSVVARANGYGKVTIPVLIVAGRQTAVHLEGPGSWGDPSVDRSKLVSLPDGQIVGYRANLD